MLLPAAERTPEMGSAPSPFSQVPTALLPPRFAGIAARGTAPALEAGRIARDTAPAADFEFGPSLSKHSDVFFVCLLVCSDGSS